MKKLHTYYEDRGPEEGLHAIDKEAYLRLKEYGSVEHYYRYANNDVERLIKAAEEIESRLRNAGLEHDADYLRAALEGK